MAKSKKAVESAVDGVEVDKFGNLAHLGFNGFKLPVTNDGRMKKVFLFGLHGVENTAVGVDSNKSSKGWIKVAEVVLCKFFHNFFQRLEKDRQIGEERK